jgi:hypothetical protein
MSRYNVEPLERSAERHEVIQLVRRIQEAVAELASLQGREETAELTARLRALDQLRRRLAEVSRSAAAHELDTAA